MSHYILKLVSGELVYGVIDPKKSDKTIVLLNNPLTWEEYESPDGATGSALVKYINGTKETAIPITTSSISSMAAMSPAFVDYYNAAVSCQQITDEAYDEKLVYLTRKINDLVIDYQMKMEASKTGGIIFTETDTDTIH